MAALAKDHHLVQIDGRRHAAFGGKLGDGDQSGFFFSDWDCRPRCVRQTVVARIAAFDVSWQGAQSRLEGLRFNHV